MAGLATVLVVATLVQKWVKEAATQPVAAEDVSQLQRDEGTFISRWLRALWSLFWSTIPVYILAVLVLGAARVWLFPHAEGAVDNTLFWVIAMAIAGCLFVIPTAAEIPIVQTMLLAGMGTAPALALLITLPAVSVPSLVMLRKAFPAKSAVANRRAGGVVRGDRRRAGAGVIYPERGCGPGAGFCAGWRLRLTRPTVRADCR